MVRPCSSCACHARALHRDLQFRADAARAQRDLEAARLAELQARQQTQMNGALLTERNTGDSLAPTAQATAAAEALFQGNDAKARQNLIPYSEVINAASRLNAARVAQVNAHTDYAKAVLNTRSIAVGYATRETLSDVERALHRGKSSLAGEPMAWDR